ncbi:MAG TPA: fumarylacetoacetate hydrolase family protein [Nocardioides sp.]|nr:fumarylacetoacetate hydrolase family protein [Nocardioides sp.]
MRFATIDGRMKLVAASGKYVDVETASAGRLPADPQIAYERWDDLVEWSASAVDQAGAEAFAEASLGAPSPRPRQVFAIGFNYRDHVNEAGTAVPEALQTFTKFQSAIAGPYSDVVLPSEHVDWEAELVVVMGRTAHRVGENDAWAHVAGLTIGQDYSERALQVAGEYPQFSLAKSFPGFAPTGPVLVTLDEFADADDLSIQCEINGEIVQSGRTSAMIFPIPTLIARLSAVCTLHPGDLIFTGTPSGVGFARTPARYLTPGDVVTTRVEQIGEIRQTCIEKRHD